MPHQVNHDQSIRYHRQLIMPEIGPDGQARIQQARVLVPGVGGLGSISATYLVAAGIGRLRIVDRDLVELGNLNRQILHTTDDIGRAKTESALEKLRRLNPACQIEALREEITDQSLDRLLGDCSLIVDGTDNLATRRILNRTSIRRNVPYVFGGVEGLDGMVTTFVPGETACLECLFPEREVPERTPGVLGATPGLVASIQTLEAIKLIVGIPGTLRGRLLCMRGADMSFREVKLERNPDCAVCGSARGIEAR